jgi:hypothetical protein
MADAAQAVTAPSAEEVAGWAGLRLDAIAGAAVGRVEGAFIDSDSGSPVWLLARMGRFGHRTLVPGRDAVAGFGHVWVPYTRDRIRRAPRVDPQAPLTAGGERLLLAHYGIAADLGRAAEIADRDPADVTAEPG